VTHDPDQLHRRPDHAASRDELAALGRARAPVRRRGGL